MTPERASGSPSGPFGSVWFRTSPRMRTARYDAVHEPV